jgi:hypothetical protein
MDNIFKDSKEESVLGKRKVRNYLVDINDFINAKNEEEE